MPKLLHKLPKYRRRPVRWPYAWQHAEQDYVEPNGKPTSEHLNYNTLIKRILSAECFAWACRSSA